MTSTVMEFNVWLFLKVSLFFEGLTFAASYAVHRVRFAVSSRQLARHYPEAFAQCFSLITDFYEIARKQSEADVLTFLRQVITRRNLDIPRQFKNLPVQVVEAAYRLLRKPEFSDTYASNPAAVIKKIQNIVYSEYFSSYRRFVLNESKNWLLMFIPFAFASGILLPLLLYFYLPQSLAAWPDLLTVSGLAVGIFALVLMIRDYRS